MIRLIVDSASDITQEQAKEWGITVLPLTVRFGAEEFQDGINLNADEFYQRLTQCSELPKTSQVTPFAYEEAYREAIARNEEILVLAISGKLSGCYQSAIYAAKEFNHPIYIVDTETGSSGVRVLAELALKYIADGMSCAEVAQAIESDKKKLHIIALLDTLEYLKKGGRISAAMALAGTMLGIKPVITLDGGVVKLLGKARGSKSGNNMLIQMIRDAGGIDFSRPYCLMYSGLSSEKLEKYKQDSKDIYENETSYIPVSRMGSTIGTYAGPGAVGVVFFGKEN